MKVVVSKVYRIRQFLLRRYVWQHEAVFIWNNGKNLGRGQVGPSVLICTDGKAGSAVPHFGTAKSVRFTIRSEYKYLSADGA